MPHFTVLGSIGGGGGGGRKKTCKWSFAMAFRAAGFYTQLLAFIVLTLSGYCFTATLPGAQVQVTYKVRGL